jgi:hypothetical protein
MSILINMDMPKSCGFCPMRYESDIGDACFASSDVVTEYQKRPDDCPLVYVPQHGRLIDADALIVELMDRGLEGLQTDDWHEIQQTVDDAPTIIPAEEGE